MKDIGKTEAGGFIVEMTEKEHHALWWLAYAASGNAGKYTPSPTTEDRFRGDEDDDMAEVLYRVRLWTEVKANADRLRVLADDMNKAIHLEYL